MNFSIKLLLSILLMTWIFSCTDNPAESGDNLTGIRSYVDASGDASFSFVDLDTVSISTSDTIITVKISVGAFPPTLPYCRAEVPANKLEYQWGVYLDVDENGTDSEGDIFIGLNKFKPPSGASPGEAPVLEITQHDVSRFTSEGGYRRIFGPEVQLYHSTISISIDHDQLSLLYTEGGLAPNVPLKFATAYYDNGNYIEDFYPDDGYGK